MPNETLRRLAWAALALAAFHPGVNAAEAPLILQGSAAYYGLRIPLTVQAQTRSPELSDIQVLNARGEPVPHAWADEAAAPLSEEQVHKLPFFKAPQAASAVDAAQQGGWIIDARAVTDALLELELGAAPDAHGIYGFVLEYSADLQHWHTHTEAAQWVSLQQQGLRLENTRFELNGLRARYLRLRPLPGNAEPPLISARVTSISHFVTAPPLQWSEALVPAQCTAQYCDYTLPRHLPLERLSWQLADANTLAAVDLLVQYDAGSTPPSPTPSSAPPHRHHHHLLRGTLHELRHKTAPSPRTPMASWQPLHRSTVYWLRLPEGELRSPELSLGAGLVARLRVQPVGGMVQLGAKPPTIRVGAPAVSLVFLARGPAPYRLAWGGPDAASALPLSQLMPTRQPGDPLPTDTARVEVSAALPALANAAAASSATPASPTAPARANKLWLWAALLAALGLMGAMAWSLLRPGDKT